MTFKEDKIKIDARDILENWLVLSDASQAEFDALNALMRLIEAMISGTPRGQ